MSMALALACLAAAWAQGERGQRAQLAWVSSLALTDLADVAGLREDGKLPVDVVQDAGPLWVSVVLREAVARSGAFASGASPHLVHAEVVPAWSALALRVSLVRQGWSIRAPAAWRVVHAPWRVGLVTLMGLGCAGVVLSWLRPRGRAHAVVHAWTLAVVVAALCVQTVLACWPWPHALPAAGVFEQLRAGPATRQLVQWVHALPTWFTPLAVGALVLTTTLMLFDHRRSPGQGGTWMVATAVMVAGGVVLAEGLLRGAASVFFSLPGWLCLLACGVVVVLRVRADLNGPVRAAPT